MKNQQRIAFKLSAIASGIVLVLLAACGGGGSDGATPTPNGGGGNVPVVDPTNPVKPDGKVVDTKPPILTTTPQNGGTTTVGSVVSALADEAIKSVYCTVNGQSTPCFVSGEGQDHIKLIDSSGKPADLVVGQNQISISATDYSGNSGNSQVVITADDKTATAWTPPEGSNVITFAEMQNKTYTRSSPKSLCKGDYNNADNCLGTSYVEIKEGKYVAITTGLNNTVNPGKYYFNFSFVDNKGAFYGNKKTGVGDFWTVSAYTSKSGDLLALVNDFKTMDECIAPVIDYPSDTIQYTMYDKSACD